MGLTRKNGWEGGIWEPYCGPSLMTMTFSIHRINAAGTLAIEGCDEIALYSYFILFIFSIKRWLYLCSLICIFNFLIQFAASGCKSLALVI